MGVYLSMEIREVTRHAGRRHQGAIANSVAADAHDPVAVDRARAGADHGARDRPAAPAELVCDLWRGLGRGDAGAELPYAAEPARLGALDCGRPRRRALGIFLMPAITSLIAGFFVEDVGDLVE